MKIKVESINEALGFVKPGLSANSYIQLAGTISMLVLDKKLYFVTEPDDGEVKYQTAVCDVDASNDAVAVNGFQFIQAMSTCSGSTVDLTIMDDKISLDNGRGALFLPILIDDDGKKVANTLSPITGDPIKVSNTEPLKLVTSCLSGTMDNLAIRNVYCAPGITLASDLVNIAKGPEVLATEMLVTGRMRDFLLRFPECRFLNDAEHFTLIQGNKEAIFTKGFQDYLDEFPVTELQAEFEQNKEHSFTVDMEAFLNALSFLRVTTNSVNDYAVKLKAAGPNSIELESEHGSTQTLPVTWLTNETGPWEVSFDCVSALSRFSFADGIRQVDVYESQIACVGPIEVSLGLILDD